MFYAYNVLKSLHGRALFKAYLLFYVCLYVMYVFHMGTVPTVPKGAPWILTN